MKTSAVERDLVLFRRRQNSSNGERAAIAPVVPSVSCGKILARVAARQVYGARAQGVRGC